jgi:tRNA(fMet)-specific endonuclease VapC
MKKVLLDTNAYTSLLAGDEKVLDALAGADRVFMSTVVLGELFAGFGGGSRERDNRRRLDDFLRRPPVRSLDVTRGTAEVFGEIKNQLRRAGTPIPMNDVWIAAHAVENGAWLVTHDRHFLEVGGLLLWSELVRE